MEETIEVALLDEYVLHDDPAEMGKTVQGSPEVWLKQLATEHGDRQNATGTVVDTGANVDRASSLQWGRDAGEVGVLASAPRKASLYKPGQSGNPSGRRKTDLAMLHTIAAEFPPGEVVDMVRSAWESAVTRNSSKSKLEVARFIVEYVVGKPKQFVAMSKGSPEQWLQALAQVQLPDTEGE